MIKILLNSCTGTNCDLLIELGLTWVKLKSTKMRTPRDDKMMPIVGVSCLDRLARAAGRKPRSAIPSNWKLSLLISASNCPIWLTAAAATTHHESQFPPTYTRKKSCSHCFSYSHPSKSYVTIADPLYAAGKNRVIFHRSLASMSLATALLFQTELILRHCQENPNANGKAYRASHRFYTEIACVAFNRNHGAWLQLMLRTSSLINRSGRLEKNYVVK